ncbi:hypothetical protein VNO77_23248 [Canavalia gladiata]|uniref:Uncharacterized protein n=1 Tax=Canavalia gladiata TaxID=3824 RepID=A0AAN9QBJ4_CANGL
MSSFVRSYSDSRTEFLWDQIILLKLKLSSYAGEYLGTLGKVMSSAPNSCNTVEVLASFLLMIPGSAKASTRFNSGLQIPQPQLGMVFSLEIGSEWRRFLEVLFSSSGTRTDSFLKSRGWNPQED